MQYSAEKDTEQTIQSLVDCIKSFQTQFETELPFMVDKPTSSYQIIKSLCELIITTMKTTVLHDITDFKTNNLNKPQPLVIIPPRKKYISYQSFRFANAPSAVKLNTDIINKYPDSYLYSLIQQPELVDEENNFFIDHDYDRFDYVYKYMCDNNTTFDSLDLEDQCKVVDMMNFLSIDVPEVLDNAEKEFKKRDAWKFHRILLSNSKESKILNNYIMENNLSDQIFGNVMNSDCHYDEKKGIVTMSKDLKYSKLIEEYIKTKEFTKPNEKLNLNVLKNEFQFFNITLKDEYIESMCGILLPGSLIVNINQINNFPKWIKMKKPWICIYRGSRDGFECKTLHEKCNNKESLVIIKSRNHGVDCIFGGYTKKGWGKPEGYESGSQTRGWRNDFSAFQYTIVNPHNIPPRKYKTNSMFTTLPCGADDEYGVIFSAGLHTLDKCNKTNKNCIWAQNYHYCAYEYDEKLGNSLFVNTAGPTEPNYFTVDEIEIYSPPEKN